MHTGKFANLVKKKKNYRYEFNKIKKTTLFAINNNIEVHAGHGLDYQSTKLLSKIKGIKEFNIGHFIIGESIFFGLKNIIKNIKNKIN